MAKIASDAPVTTCTLSTLTPCISAQAVGACGPAVDQFVIQEAMALFLAGETEDVVHGPGRTGARGEVEFYVVFVLVEPGIEQEGLESHASTSKEKLAPIIDSASGCTDDFLVYETLGAKLGDWRRWFSTDYL